jgi:tRNA G18 (ribose-2'-O)-methylase SpoU
MTQTFNPSSFHPNEPPLKLIKKLQRKKESEHYQLCLVEGWKCFDEARQKFNPKAVFLKQGQSPPLGIPSDTPIFFLEDKTFVSLCSTQSPEGILGVFPRPCIEKKLPEAKTGELHLLLYEWRDPNNLGAVIRSARGLGAKSITLCGSGPDFFSAKVIRTSMGSVFHTSLFQLDDLKTLPTPQQLFLADAGGEPIENLRLNQKEPVFILIGSESHGWPNELKNLGRAFSFPLENQLESLSAPIAASLSIYAFKKLLQT